LINIKSSHINIRVEKYQNSKCSSSKCNSSASINIEIESAFNVRAIEARERPRVAMTSRSDMANEIKRKATNNISFPAYFFISLKYQ